MIIDKYLPPLILASTSRSRKKLLNQLRLPFSTVNPQCEEDIIFDETAEERSLRLSRKKGISIQEEYPNHLIISGDQVATLASIHNASGYLHKTKDYKSAYLQLQKISGQIVDFYSGLYVLDTSIQQEYSCIVTTRIKFRSLSEQQIEYYILNDQPFDCAASIQLESLGIGLVEDIQTSDPSAVIGLPLIQLTNILTKIHENYENQAASSPEK